MGGEWGGMGRAMQDGWGMGRDGQDDAGWVVNRQSNTVGEHCSNGSRGDHHSSWTKRDTDMSDGVPTIMNPLGRGEASPCHRPARLAFVMGSSRRIQQGREGSTVWDPAGERGIDRVGSSRGERDRLCGIQQGREGSTVWDPAGERGIDRVGSSNLRMRQQSSNHAQ